jgi:hypothetical protein
MTVRQLHVLGPNLLGSGTPETFHVHAQGCPDVHHRRLYAGREHDWDRTHTYPAECLDLVAAVYADILAESDETVADYRHDFRLFACVGDLPDTPDT